MDTSVWTQEADYRLRMYLATHELVAGRGSAEAPCSVAAINIALTGRLTRTVPDCMSAVLGCWVMALQDSMPGEVRNGSAWKGLLPGAAATGRAQEQERLQALLDWVWQAVLPILQGLADQKGFGDEWRTLCGASGAAREAQTTIAQMASEAASSAASEASEAAGYAASATLRAGQGKRGMAAADAAEAAGWTAKALGAASARAAGQAALRSGRHVADRASARASARDGAIVGAWGIFNPVGVLQRAIGA